MTSLPAPLPTQALTPHDGLCTGEVHRDVRELGPGWIRHAAHVEALAPVGVTAEELARIEDADAEALHHLWLLQIVEELRGPPR